MLGSLNSYTWTVKVATISWHWEICDGMSLHCMPSGFLAESPIQVSYKFVSVFFLQVSTSKQVLIVDLQMLCWKMTNMYRGKQQWPVEECWKRSLQLGSLTSLQIPFS